MCNVHHVLSPTAVYEFRDADTYMYHVISSEYTRDFKYRETSRWYDWCLGYELLL